MEMSEARFGKALGKAEYVHSAYRYMTEVFTDYGREIASPDKARRIIGLSKRHQPRIRIESVQDFSDARVEERVK